MSLDRKRKYSAGSEEERKRESEEKKIWLIEEKGESLVDPNERYKRCLKFLDRKIESNWNFGSRSCVARLSNLFQRNKNGTLHDSKGNVVRLEFFEDDGYPTDVLYTILCNLVEMVSSFHEAGFIHGKLEPWAVSIMNKESHFGAMASADGFTTRFGNKGWQAPEQRRGERPTPAVDSFALGCLLYFCLTGGEHHPFGDGDDELRARNIAKNRLDISWIEHIPDAVDLIPRLLDHSPDKRPSVEDIMFKHPLFWERRERFFHVCMVGEAVFSWRGTGKPILESLGHVASVALAPRLKRNAGEKMEDLCSDDDDGITYDSDGVVKVLREFLEAIEAMYSVDEFSAGRPETYCMERYPFLCFEAYKVMLNHLDLAPRDYKERYGFLR